MSAPLDLTSSVEGVQNGQVAAVAEGQVQSAPQADVGQAQGGQQAQDQGQVTSQPAAGGASQSAAGSWSLRSELAKLGLKAEQFPDDGAAWQHVQSHLQSQAQQYQHAQQQLAWQQAQLEQLQRAQQQAAQPAAPPAQPEKWWAPPEYNPLWEKPIMERDGQPVTPADLDPSVRLRLQQYNEWRRDKFNTFLTDPIKTIEPGLKSFVEPLIKQAIEQHLGLYRDRQFADQWTQQHQEHLYARSPDGQPLRDFQGRPVLSPVGQRYAQYVQWLDGQGLRAPQQQAQLAMQLLELEAYKQQATKQAPTNDQLKQAAVAQQGTRGAARLAGAGGAPPVPLPANGHRGTDPRLKLREGLTAALAASGIDSN